jgi:outer membrane protein assembly factor BamA
MSAYPFSTTRRVEGNIGVQRWSFDLEEDRYFLSQFGEVGASQRISLPSREPINLASASIALVGDNSLTGFTSPIDGGRFRLEASQTLGTLNYTSVVADFRRYLSPSRNITFAARGLHFGRYGNNLDPDRSTAAIQPYFLGWETFVRGYAYESFDPEECAITSFEPGAVAGTCAGFDRLFGHRLVVANLEMRVPLLGTPQFGLINFPFVPTEIVLFADAGVAWNELSEVDFDFQRSGGKRVPVFSVGASARINILGFLILESYYALPFQRPDKGGHWGFVLSPGW